MPKPLMTVRSGPSYFEARDKIAAAREKQLADAVAERDLLRSALKDLVEAFHNPYDGGEFEDGEVPALDAACKLLNR